MNQLEHLQVQLALSAAHRELHEKQKAIYQQHDLNWKKGDADKAHKSWQYYTGYRDAVMALLKYSLSLEKPTQLELNFDD
tara:strand:+ start:169 stop:408 length:240 start_codon:yes stop_codon:yes gene_type:complete